MKFLELRVKQHAGSSVWPIMLEESNKGGPTILKRISGMHHDREPIFQLQFRFVPVVRFNDHCAM